MLRTLDEEFRCLDEDSMLSDHILNESETFGRTEINADFIDISKHITQKDG